MRELASAAGLHPSSIYYYFESKEAIVRAMVTEMNQMFFDEIHRIDGAGGSAGTRLHRLIRRDVELLCHLPYDLNEAMQISELQDEEFEFFWADRERLHDAVERIVAEGVATGEFVDVDTRLTALAVLANDKGVQSWYRPIGRRHLARRHDDAADYTPVEIGLFLADLTVGGLLSDRGQLAESGLQLCERTLLAEQIGVETT